MTTLEREFKPLTIPSTGMVLIEFWSLWNTLSQEECMLIAELAEGYVGEVEVVRVNIEEEPALAAKYNVYTVPTLNLAKDGKVVEKFVGRANKQEVSQVIGRWIDQVERVPARQSESDFVVDWTIGL